MNYLPLLKAGIDRLHFWLVVGGVPGVVGAAFLGAAAVGQFLILPRIEESAAIARATAAREHRAYLKAAEAARGGAPDAAESLARFRAMLTSEKAAAEAFEAIQRDAKKHGLVPDGTEYKWQRQADARLAEVRIAMSLKGGYGALRSFVRDVLADVPGLALEQFDLQREGIGTAATEARVGFTLFLRIEP